MGKASRKKAEQADVPWRDKILRLPAWGIVQFAARCVRRVQWVSWNVRVSGSGRWVEAVNGVLGCAEEAAATGKKPKDAQRFFEEIEDVAADVGRSAGGAVAGVVSATCKVADCVQGTYRIASYLKKGKYLPARETKKRFAEIAAWVWEQASQAVEERRRPGLAAALAEDLEELVRNTAAKREQEDQESVLQPVPKEDFGERLPLGEAGKGKRTNYFDEVENGSTLPHPIREQLGRRQAANELEALEEELAELVKPSLAKFRRLLRQLEGATFASYEQKAEVVSRVNRLARTFQQRLLFTAQPVTLHCLPPAPRGTGIFQVRQGAKALYGKATFPPLTCASPEIESPSKTVSS